MDEEKSIEEIKEIVDNKRPRKYTKEDRIKNLQIAREKKQLKKQELKEPIIEPVAVIVKTEPEPIKEIKQKEVKMTKVKSINNDIDKLADIYNDIKILKELINQQTNFIQEVINKPKEKKERAKPKPKEVIKTLDLTSFNTELNEILENKPKPKDNRLEEIIKALQKC